MRALARRPCGLLLHGLDRVHDHGAVDNAEHRASKTNQIACRAILGTAEQRLCRSVIEQHATVAIAHQNALIELRHECSKAFAFFVDLRFRFGCRSGVLCHQLRSDTGEIIDGLHHAAQGRRTRKRQPMFGIAMRGQLHFFGDLPPIRAS